jgi:sporulation protein YlmC with PRC-barrel domain
VGSPTHPTPDRNVHLDLAHDVLDKQMVDRHGRRCGKVDGLVLRLDDGPPRLVAIQIGAGTLARRLGARAGAWAAAFTRWWGLRGGAPYRIPWRRVEAVALEVTLDLDAERSQLDAAERWLREKIVDRIPGGRS